VRTSIQASQDLRWHLTARQMGLSSPQFAVFEDLRERIRPMFARPEPHRQAMLYMLGLLGQVERKNSWQLAGFAGEESPWRMQRLLNRATWDVDGVLDVVRDLVASRLADPGAVLSFGEIGVIKKGASSVAVARQFTEVTRQVDNCQVGVFAAYVSGHGGGLIDRELFLPECWSADAERCRRAGVPDERATFLPKPELATRMIGRILAAGPPLTWVSAGLTYGRDESLRRWLEARRIRYVLAVPPVQRLLRPVRRALLHRAQRRELPRSDHPRGRARHVAEHRVRRVGDTRGYAEGAGHGEPARPS